MSDNDATHRLHRVADPLREFVKAYGSATYNETHNMTFGEYEAKLLDFADQIDREHELRMEQSKNDMRKATCRYISRVVEDYKHGRKWKRKEYE